MVVAGSTWLPYIQRLLKAKGLGKGMETREMALTEKAKRLSDPPIVRGSP